MVSRRRAKPGCGKNGSRRRSIFHRLPERRWRFSQKRIKTEPNRPSMPLPPHSRFLPSNHWFRETSKLLRHGTSGTLSCPHRSESQRHPRVSRKCPRSFLRGLTCMAFVCPIRGRSTSTPLRPYRCLCGRSLRLCRPIHVPWGAERPRGSAAVRNDLLPVMVRP